MIARSVLFALGLAVVAAHADADRDPRPDRQPSAPPPMRRLAAQEQVCAEAVRHVDPAWRMLRRKEHRATDRVGSGTKNSSSTTRRRRSPLRTARRARRSHEKAEGASRRVPVKHRPRPAPSAHRCARRACRRRFRLACPEAPARPVPSPPARPMPKGAAMRGRPRRGREARMSREVRRADESAAQAHRDTIKKPQRRSARPQGKVGRRRCRTPMPLASAPLLLGSRDCSQPGRWLRSGGHSSGSTRTSASDRLSPPPRARCRALFTSISLASRAGSACTIAPSLTRREVVPEPVAAGQKAVARLRSLVDMRLGERRLGIGAQATGQQVGLRMGIGFFRR